MDTVERYTKLFMKQHPVQYNLFQSPEETEAEIQQVVKQGVTEGLKEFLLYQKALDAMNVMDPTLRVNSDNTTEV